MWWNAKLDTLMDGWRIRSDSLEWVHVAGLCDSFYSAAAVGIHAEDDLLQDPLSPWSADKHLLVTTIQATWSVCLRLPPSLNDCFSKVRFHLINAFILFESKLKFGGRFTRTHVPSCLSIEFFSPDMKLNHEHRPSYSIPSWNIYTRWRFATQVLN